MDFTQYFKKELQKSYRRVIPFPVTDDNYVVQEQECRASDEWFQWHGVKSELSAEQYWTERLRGGFEWLNGGNGQLHKRWVANTGKDILKKVEQHTSRECLADY